MRKKRKSGDGGFNVWRSYSDVMAGVLLLFILIMSLTLFQAQKSYDESIQERDEKLALQAEYTADLLAKQNTIEEQENTSEKITKKAKEKKSRSFSDYGEDGDENIVYVKLIRRSVLISTTGIYRFRLHALSRERDRNRTCFHRSLIYQLLFRTCGKGQERQKSCQYYIF